MGYSIQRTFSMKMLESSTEKQNKKQKNEYKFSFVP